MVPTLKTTFAKAFLLALLLLEGKPAAFSQTAFPTGPKDYSISGDRVEYDEKRDTLVFTGNVKAKRRETTSFAADELVFSQKASGKTSVKGKGNAKFCRQGTWKTEADIVRFEEATEQLELEGRAEILFRNLLVETQFLRADTKTFRFKAQAEEGGFVKVRRLDFFPSPDKPLFSEWCEWSSNQTKLEANQELQAGEILWEPDLLTLFAERDVLFTDRETDIVIRADSMEARLDTTLKARKIKASGNFEWRQSERESFAEAAEIDLHTGTITLRNNVRIRSTANDFLIETERINLLLDPSSPPPDTDKEKPDHETAN